MATAAAIRKLKRQIRLLQHLAAHTTSQKFAKALRAEIRRLQKQLVTWAGQH